MQPVLLESDVNAEATANRRRARRLNTRPYPVYLTDALQDNPSAPSIGQLCDIGLGGMRISTPSVLAINESVRLTVIINDEYAALSFTVTARTAWVSPGEQPSTFEVGYEFRSRDETASRRITTLIAALSPRDPASS